MFSTSTSFERDGTGVSGRWGGGQEEEEAFGGLGRGGTKG